MKLKKILASVTAAVMGLSVMAFAPAGGVSAESGKEVLKNTQKVSGEFTGDYNTHNFDVYNKWGVGEKADDYSKIVLDYTVNSVGNAKQIALCINSNDYVTIDGKKYTGTNWKGAYTSDLTTGENQTLELDMSQFSGKAFEAITIQVIGTESGSFTGDITFNSVKLYGTGSSTTTTTPDVWEKNSDGKWQYISSKQIGDDKPTIIVDLKAYTSADAKDITSVKVNFIITGESAGGGIGTNDYTRYSKDPNNSWKQEDFNSTGTTTLSLGGALEDESGKANLQIQLWWANPGTTVVVESIDVEAKSSSDEVSVSVSPTSKSIKVGETATITATVSNVSNATDTSVTWKSSDTSVATVDDKGVVTAVKAGTATITATSVADTTKSATCAITVTEDSTEPDTPDTPDTPAEKVTLKLSSTSASVKAGENTTITATVANDATDTSVTWKSSDESVATVKDGVVTGVKAGTATITATSVADTTVSATCTVTVTEETKVDPTPTPVVTYYGVTNSSPYIVSTNKSSAVSGDTVTVSVLPGYYAVVTANGSEVAKITGTGTFTMPSDAVTIKAYADSSYAFIAASFGKSYIRVNDGGKLVGTFKTKTEGVVNIKLGSKYAGKTVNIYIGKGNTTDLYKTVELDSNGRATVEVENSTNYNAVVE